MREIKFRGKRKDNGEWVNGDRLRIDGKILIVPHDCTIKITAQHIVNNDHMGFGEVSQSHIGSDSCWPTEVIPETVGQWTGLYDATKWDDLTDIERTLWNRYNLDTWPGKPIYEGDIIETKGFDVEGFVYYSQEMSRFEWGSTSMPLDLIWDSTGMMAKVIGNVTDNNELLTAQ